MMASNALQYPVPDADRPLIAVVDDDASFLRSMGRLLRSTGYTVQTFSSARELLAALPTWLPQCLVLDIQMPEMNGLELQDRLAAQGTCVPIIFVTAFDTPQTREAARKGGALELLLKPFDKHALLRAIRTALGGHPGNGNGEHPSPLRCML